MSLDSRLTREWPNASSFGARIAVNCVSLQYRPIVLEKLRGTSGLSLDDQKKVARQGIP
jgi:hypothetical protein